MGHELGKGLPRQPSLGSSPAVAVVSWTCRHLKAQTGCLQDGAPMWLAGNAGCQTELGSAADHNTWWSQVAGFPQRTRWKLRGIFLPSLRHCTLSLLPYSIGESLRFGPDSRGGYLNPTTQQKEGLSIYRNIFKPSYPSNMKLQSVVF